MKTHPYTPQRMDAARAEPDLTARPFDAPDATSARELVDAQEAERARIAQEVHDGPAQALTNAIFHVELIERALIVDPATALTEIDGLRDMLRRELDNVRAFIDRLRPPLLDELGLDGAIEATADNLRATTSIIVTTSLAASADGLDDQERTVALRVAQEAMQNVRKHAEATTVVVDTQRTNGDWTLEIRDDGRGFDPAAIARGGRNFGVRFMRERAELIGARFHIRSRPEGGTVVRLEIPTGARMGAKENG